MGSPIRIALLTTGIFPYVVGGMQRHAQLLAEHMARAGADVTLFHTARDPAAIERARGLVGLDRDIWARIRGEFVPSPPAGRLPGHYVPDARRYSAALLDHYRRCGVEADFIYAQGLSGLAFTAARRRGEPLPPVAINVHGYEMFQRAWTLRSRLEQALLRPTFARLTREADHVFSYSGKIRDIVERRLGVPAARIIEMPNAIDDSWIVAAPVPCHRPRSFVFVGRDDPRKGARELHAALRTLSGTPLRFDFIGPIPEALRIREPHVTYHGVVPDTAARQAILDAADVLVCPSFSEGMPTVVLEAMARGLAVVGTDVGAVREIVSADNGILLPRPDVPLVAGAIARLAAMPDDELSALKRGSLAKAPRYGWRDVTARTLAAIASALDRGGA